MENLMAYKKHTFPKLGRKFHQLGKKKKGGLTPAEWQKKRQEIMYNIDEVERFENCTKLCKPVRPLLNKFIPPCTTL